jgi:hypothetical protein
VVTLEDLAEQVTAVDLLHLLKEKAIRHLQDQLLLLQVAEAVVAAVEAAAEVVVQHVVEAEVRFIF